MSKYLVVDRDINEEYSILCETEEIAMREAQILLANNQNIQEVVIYQLHKVGRRQSAVAWDSPKKANGIERPAYQGANKRWSDDEVAYLKTAKQMGMTFDGIAKKLGRSPHAVELKFSRI